MTLVFVGFLCCVDYVCEWSISRVQYVVKVGEWGACGCIDSCATGLMVVSEWRVLFFKQHGFTVFQFCCCGALSFINWSFFLIL